MNAELEMYKGYVHQVPVGYWRRGNDQYWHIKEDSALLINLSVEGKHYDGDGHYIFFQWPDSTIRYHLGREKITKREFEKIRRKLIHRISSF